MHKKKRTENLLVNSLSYLLKKDLSNKWITLVAREDPQKKKKSHKDGA